MSKFAPGDTVVITGDLHESVASNPGINPVMEHIAEDQQVRTVLLVDDKLPWVQLTNAQHPGGHVFWWHTDWLEHARCEMI